MENLLLEWDEKAIEIKNLVHKLKECLGENPTPKSIRDGLTAFDNSVKTYAQATESDDIEKIAQAAKMVAVYGQSIGQAIPKFKEADNQLISLGNDLLNQAGSFRSLVEDSPLEYKPLENNENHVDINSFQSIKKKLKVLAEDHEKHDQRVKKLLNENEVRLENINISSNKLEAEIKAEIDKVASLYKNALDEIESKKEQIDEILGHVSGRAIAGDFENSAGEEKSMANWLRYASLACMFLIVGVVGYSFWETTSSDFNWKNSIFRIVLAFMLSIPAAYLARESAKHREQQYAHQQTSLDLKAISPYIASLPEGEQHKIKIEIASRLFAAKDFSKVGADPYPVNTHEIMMEIIKKLDFKKSEPKP
ncbi:hypothetical protein [Marinobacter sp.]|uniref:hypothetical protein n=1 Tax=Marinobacter sp. TaxID=50741 RepID=UPI002B277F84|nr:hypothetical protein [Marinobacter sp.]